MIHAQPLFRPLALGKLTLQNRVVMAPMTRKFSPGGVPGADVAAYYRRRAENGVGLIITEGTAINHPAAVNDANIPNFHGASALAGWAHVAAEVHAAGGRIMPQLWHIGSVRKLGDNPNPEALAVSPSGLSKPGVKIGEPATLPQIEALIEAYARAAAEAKRIGFDGIELHGAHGYLIDQFFWEGTNTRSDRFGGSIAARTRFAVEIIGAIRRTCGADFPLVLRFSQWKSQDYLARLARDPQELAEFLAPLSNAGVDLFHCSTRRFWEPEFPGSPLNLAGWTKKLTGKPVITVGSIGLDNDFINSLKKGESAAPTGISRLNQMIESGEVDLAAVGRAVLSDPCWAAKIRDGREDQLKPYHADALKSLI